METIVVNVRTNSRYGLVNPDDTLVVGKDIDEASAARWVENGIARPGNLAKKPGKPTSSNTKAEIKEDLDAQGVEYASDALKKDLLELV